MMHLVPAEVKGEIRQLANVVHERRLGKELARLEGEFARWRRGEIDAFELASTAHRFHEGAPRELWQKFNSYHLETLKGLVAEAIADGTLRVEEVSAETLALLSRK